MRHCQLFEEMSRVVVSCALVVMCTACTPRPSVNECVGVWTADASTLDVLPDATVQDKPESSVTLRDDMSFVAVSFPVGASAVDYRLIDGQGTWQLVRFDRYDAIDLNFDEGPVATQYMGIRGRTGKLWFAIYVNGFDFPEKIVFRREDQKVEAEADQHN